MNRYEALGLCTAVAIEGKRRVVVLSTTGRAAHAAYEVVAAEAPQFGTVRMRACNGAQRIDFADGGAISFHSLDNAGVRGVSADVVYTDEVAAHIVGLERDRLWHYLNTAAFGGEVVHG